MPGKRLALLIDAENISAQLFPQVLEHVRNLGDPIVARAFGDFSNRKLSDWVEVGRAEGRPELIFQVSAGKGKNSADIAIAIAAMDLLQERVVEGFCLVSSDRDFVPLITRLRRSGIDTYCVGESKTAQTLRNASSAFFEVTPARQKPVGKASKSSPSDDDIDTRIARTLRAVIGSNKGWVSHGGLRQAMIRKEPTLEPFFPKGKFLERLRSTGLIEQIGAGPGIKIRLKEPH